MASVDNINSIQSGGITKPRQNVEQSAYQSLNEYAVDNKNTKGGDTFTFSGDKQTIEADIADKSSATSAAATFEAEALNKTAKSDGVQKPALEPVSDEIQVLIDETLASYNKTLEAEKMAHKAAFKLKDSCEEEIKGAQKTIDELNEKGMFSESGIYEIEDEDGSHTQISNQDYGLSLRKDKIENDDSIICKEDIFADKDDEGECKISLIVTNRISYKGEALLKDDIRWFNEKEIVTRDDGSLNNCVLGEKRYTNNSDISITAQSQLHAHRNGKLSLYKDTASFKNGSKYFTQMLDETAPDGSFQRYGAGVRTARNSSSRIEFAADLLKKEEYFSAFTRKYGVGPAKAETALKLVEDSNGQMVPKYFYWGWKGEGTRIQDTDTYDYKAEFVDGKWVKCE